MIIYDKAIDTISTDKIFSFSEEAIGAIASKLIVYAAEASVDMLRDDNHEEYPTKESIDSYLENLCSISEDMAEDFLGDFRISLEKFMSNVKIRPMITNLKYDVEGRLEDITVHLKIEKPQA
jgi:hypothetical protein